MIESVRKVLPKDDRATLLALDGAKVLSVFYQLERIPADATHLVLSVGGNNALWMAGSVFSLPSSDVRSSMQKIAESISEFKSDYKRLIKELRSRSSHLSICTIYDSIPGLDSSDSTGLCMFNDTITRTAFENAIPLIDLRAICNESTDYATVSPIEPSALGSEKIARAILDAVSGGQASHRVIGYAT